jgi:hypothetical protein
MKTTSEAQARAAQYTGKAVEALTLWADANQKILRELAELSAAAIEEGIQLHGKVQSSTIDALREAQGYCLNRQSRLKDLQKDPFGSYQRNLLEGMQEVQTGFKLLERNTVALTQSAERFQATAEKASREIQQTCSRLVAETQGLYASAQS